METYRCKLIFTDKDVGEFQYEIIGDTTPPEIIAEIRPNSSLTVHVDTHTHYEHSIPFKNDQLGAAKKIHENRLVTSGKMKESLNRFKQQMMLPDEMMYTIELQPPNSNVAAPLTFKLVDPSKMSLKSKATFIESMNKNLHFFRFFYINYTINFFAIFQCLHIFYP